MMFPSADAPKFLGLPLPEALVKSHEDCMFIWEFLDHFAMEQVNRFRLGEDGPPLLDYWREKIAKILEMRLDEDLEQVWAVAGEEVKLKQPKLYTSCAHAAMYDLAFMVADLNFTVLLADKRTGEIKPSAEMLLVPDHIFGRAFLSALRERQMPNYVTRQRLRVKLFREFSNAKGQLGMLGATATTMADMLGQCDEPMEPTRQRTSNKKKAVREKGESRDIIIAALNAHHGYSGGACTKFDSVGVRELARSVSLGQATVSEFFASEFGGHKNYIFCCNRKTELITSLKMLNQEYTPRLLLGRRSDGRADYSEDDD